MVTLEIPARILIIENPPHNQYWFLVKTTDIVKLLNQNIWYVVEIFIYNSKLVRNHVKLGVSLRLLYCVVDTGYGLGRLLGDCRPALLKGRKYQMVKTQTESHVQRPVV